MKSLDDFLGSICVGEREIEGLRGEVRTNRGYLKDRQEQEKGMEKFILMSVRGYKENIALSICDDEIA